MGLGLDLPHGLSERPRIEAMQPYGERTIAVYHTAADTYSFIADDSTFP
jgi:hypothetical protein